MEQRPLVMLVTDRRRFGPDEGRACDGLVRAARLAAQAGVDLIQVREEALDDRRLLSLVRRVIDAVHGTVARVLVNERTDVAMAAGAAGVHLPAAAVAASRVRTIAPPGFLIGRSVHREDEAVTAEQGGGCDYLLFGTVFPSASKPPRHPVAGLAALERVCSRVRLPVLAIGGITGERIGYAARAGAAGFAAIGLFTEPHDRHVAQGDIERVERLRTLLQGVRHSFARSDRSSGQHRN